MLVDNYISEREHEKIRQSYCRKIDVYRDVRKQVQEWYRKFGFVFPHSSENNYRDSWFHYRKLYQENSTYEIISQSATMDEHLQRAEKDSVVLCLQKICEILEFWYLLMNKEIENDVNDDYLEDALMLFDKSEDNPNTWVYVLSEKYKDDIKKFVFSCIYVMKNRVFSNDFKRELQILLHDLKNDILSIRLGGAKIHRIGVPGEYLQECNNHLAQAFEFSLKYRIRELLGITDIIEDQLCILLKKVD